jgi:hypothetical protein
VVIGRGAVSIYATTAKLLRLKQTGDYTRYAKEFKEVVHDLKSQGTPEEVLNKIIDTMFILGLNREQFKQKLAIVYGKRDWPNVNDFSTELHMYAEATDRLKIIQNKEDVNSKDGQIAANLTKPTYYTRRNCYNCDSNSHLKPACTRPLNNCKICGGRGHLEKYCLAKNDNTNTKDNGSSRVNKPFMTNNKRDDNRKDSNKVVKNNDKKDEQSLKSNKSRRRMFELKKARAFVSMLEEENEEDYDEDNYQLNYDDEDKGFKDYEKGDKKD